MSKRAEEAALKAYPIEICGYVTECRVGAKPEPQDWNEERRKCFQEGYEQAEKDTIERIREQVERWMPDNPEGDEHISGERVAFRSVLVLLKDMQESMEKE